MYCLAVPTVAVERAGVLAAMSRSAQLTRGSRWRISLVIGASALIAAILERVVFIALNVLNLFGPLRFEAVFVAGHMVVVAAVALLWTVLAVIYCYRRQALEDTLAPTA
jgi:hypothetical protein